MLMQGFGLTNDVKKGLLRNLKHLHQLWQRIRAEVLLRTMQL